MKMYVNKRPSGLQRPVQKDSRGALITGPAGGEPHNISAGQGARVMISCVRERWEWEKVT